MSEIEDRANEKRHGTIMALVMAFLIAFTAYFAGKASTMNECSDMMRGQAGALELKQDYLEGLDDMLSGEIPWKPL